MGVWLRRIKPSRKAIGYAVYIPPSTTLIYVASDIDYIWLTERGAWEVDDRARCLRCSAILLPGAAFCIECSEPTGRETPALEILDRVAQTEQTVKL